jgi:hypothetical protein
VNGESAPYLGRDYRIEVTETESGDIEFYRHFLVLLRVRQSAVKCCGTGISGKQKRKSFPAPSNMNVGIPIRHALGGGKLMQDSNLARLTDPGKGVIDDVSRRPGHDVVHGARRDSGPPARAPLARQPKAFVLLYGGWCWGGGEDGGGYLCDIYSNAGAFMPLGMGGGGGGGGIGRPIDGPTDNKARSALGKRLADFDDSNCNNVFENEIDNYDIYKFEATVSNIEFYNVNKANISNLTQKQVSGNGNSTNLGQMLGTDDTAQVLPPSSRDQRGLRKVFRASESLV